MEPYISQERLFSMCDSMEFLKLKCGKWTPTEKEIDKFIEPAMGEKDMLLFVVWILETGFPSTDIDRKNRQRLMNMLNSCVLPEELESFQNKIKKGSNANE